METLEFRMISLCRFNLLLHHLPSPSHKSLDRKERWYLTFTSLGPRCSVTQVAWMSAPHFVYPTMLISSPRRTLSIHLPPNLKDLFIPDSQLSSQHLLLSDIMSYIQFLTSLLHLTLNERCTEHSRLKIPVWCLYSRRERKLFHKQVYKIVHPSCDKK